MITAVVHVACGGSRGEWTQRDSGTVYQGTRVSRRANVALLCVQHKADLNRPAGPNYRALVRLALLWVSQS
jgi:hypothetical protein